MNKCRSIAALIHVTFSTSTAARPALLHLNLQSGPDCDQKFDFIITPKAPSSAMMLIKLTIPDTSNFQNDIRFHTLEWS